MPLITFRAKGLLGDLEEESKTTNQKLYDVRTKLYKTHHNESDVLS